jgi:hypothetical protein
MLQCAMYFYKCQITQRETSHHNMYTSCAEKENFAMRISQVGCAPFRCLFLFVISHPEAKQDPFRFSNVFSSNLFSFHIILL